MNDPSVDFVVAGHVCVDIMPELGESHADFRDLIRPGRLVGVGPARLSLGGAVSNTGLALHQLGAKTVLHGLVGDDWLGDVLLANLRQRHPRLAEYMRIVGGQASSYTIVISSPHVDRAFLHFAGVNDLFSAKYLDEQLIRQARWIHFGYPPLMQGVFTDGGRELADVFRRIQSAGTCVSLDMAMPDTNGLSGQVNWRAWLANVLPCVDLFAPSFDEILWMLDRSRFDELAKRAAGDNLARAADGELLSNLSTQLLALGAPIVALKLGDKGLYVRTARNLRSSAPSVAATAVPDTTWADRELLTPCFQVTVAGTTGAGDYTVAGLLMSLLHRLPIEQALLNAVRVGAWRVQSVDAERALPTWDQLECGVASTWQLHVPTIDLRSWRCDSGVFFGPHDRQPQ